MSGIDYSSVDFWAGAPEWAGAVISSTGQCGDYFYFVERFGGVSRRQEVGSIDRGEVADMDIPGNVWRLVAERQQTWTGAGLPPVGTVCELRCKTGGWGIATVKYISPTVCAWLWSAQPEDVECCEEVHKMEFRPIRTPEQIAAEERAEAIEKMWSIYWQPHATSAKQALGLLWDAGLRFPDEKIRDNAMDIDWKRAPRWANVLLDGGCREPSRYSWAAAYETGAKRQYRDGGRIVAKVEHVNQYAVVGYRKAPTE